MSASATDIAFTKLGGHMAIAVEGLDLHHAPDASLAKTLRTALLDNLVLCIRGQSIGPGDYLATIATFGEPLVRPEIPHVPGYPAVATLSSDDRDTKGDGKRLIAGAHWHSDDTFMA
jgi:taurine dioxygenase